MPGALTYVPKSLGVMFGIDSNKLLQIYRKANTDPGTLSDHHLNVICTFEGDDYAMRCAAARDRARRERAAAASSRSISVMDALLKLDDAVFDLNMNEEQFKHTLVGCLQSIPESDWPLVSWVAIRDRDMNKANARRNERIFALETGRVDGGTRTAYLGQIDIADTTAPLTDLQRKAINPYEPPLRHLGQWESDRRYWAGDAVERNGYTFRCVSVNDGPTTSDPSIDPLRWRWEMSK